MKKTSKKRNILIAILIMIIGFGSGVTLAYYSLIATAVNEFTTATYNINISEDFHDYWGTHKVYISSDDSTNAPVLVRLNYTEAWTSISGDNTGVLSNTFNASGDAQYTVLKDWTTEFEDDFTLGADGWYYYNRVLLPGTRVQILDSIALGPYLNPQSPNYNINEAQKYVGYDYNLDFHYETIQANSNAASTLWDMTATINGVNVTWS